MTALVFLAACGGGATPPAHLPEQPVTPGQFADEDRFVPGYGKPELQKALIAERGAEASAEHAVDELAANPDVDPAAADRLRVAMADLAVRRRFIQALEACEAEGRWCPPRLDEPSWNFDPATDVATPPPLETPLRFDVEGWRAIADELHGRACACRTLACVESIEVATNQLEERAPRDVQGDDAASLALVRERDCLFRLRGLGRRVRGPAVADE